MPSPDDRSISAGRGCVDANLAAAFVDGALSPSSRASIELHLDRCDSCRTELSALAKLVHGPAGATASGHTWDAADLRLYPGDLVDRYVVDGIIGAGGMGVVYRAHDTVLHRDVALKVLRPVVGQAAATVRDRLAREAHIMARLDHPNVAVIHDVGTHRGRTFIVMQMIRGGTVRQWIAERAPPWREVLAAFMAAGRGLAAAHAANIIHRDFKPDNILRSIDGRIVVTDFGLARLDEPPVSVQPSAYDRRTGAAPMGLGASSTGLVGTPRYMAPEQLQGGPIDPRTDQFCFCVALYEALFACHPFGDGDAHDLEQAVLAGNLRTPPPKPAVFRPVLRALTRGLARQPEARFPTMDNLLAALARPRLGPKLAGAGLLVAASMAAVLGLMPAASQLGDQAAPSPTLCRQGHERLERAWNPQLRGRIRSSLSATGLPFATDLYRHISQTFDDYGEAWISAYRDTCEATHVRGEQSEHLLDLRMLCLDQRLTELGTLAQALADGADADLLANPPDLTSHLGDLGRCAETERLLAQVPVPANPETRAQVAHLRARLAQARALQLLGKFAQGLTLAQGALAAAAALDYEPVRAEALYRVGELQKATGEAEAAESLELAAQVANRYGDDELVARSWVARMQVAQRAAEYDRAAEFGERAEFALSRLGPGVELWGRLEHARGVLAHRRGDARTARSHLQRARETWSATARDPAAKAYEVLCLLAEIALSQGLLVEAQGHIHEALAVSERIHGTTHPSFAGALVLQADVLKAQGKPHLAAQGYRRALGIYEGCLGPDAPNLAATLNNLATVLDPIRDFAEVVALLARSRAIIEEIHGPDHPKLGASWGNLAGVYSARGDLLRAQESYRQALGILQVKLPADHPMILATMSNLASTAYKLGDLDEAEQLYERLHRAREASLGGAHADTAYPLDGLGFVWLARKKPNKAAGYFRRALQIWMEALGPDHPLLAYALVGLGGCALESGDPASAVRHLERAVAIQTVAVNGLVDMAEAHALLLRAVWEVERRKAG